MGSVHKTSRKGRPWDGRWRASWRDHDGRQRSKTFERKADARRFLTNVEADLARGVYVDPTNPTTLAEYVAVWLPAQAWRPQTLQLAEQQLRRHILPELGHRQLRQISRTDVQGWVNRLGQTPDRGGAGLAPATVRNLYGRLRAILRGAVLDRVIAQTPAQRIALPRAPGHAPSAVVTLTPTDIDRLADTVPPHLHALVRVLSGAGLRPGEAAGLTIDRVDFLRREIHVDRQLVTMVGEPPHLAPPKTEASARIVPIPAALADLLAAHITAHGTTSIADPAGGAAELLFANLHGRPLSRGNLHSAWHAAAEKAQLPARATGWHDLRHAYASALIAAGLSVRAVQARLGHASAVVTLDTYGHLWADSDDDTRAAVERSGLLGAATS